MTTPPPLPATHVYRNADSPNGDFGLVKQEGDEQFVVLAVGEHRALLARVEAAEGALEEANHTATVASEALLRSCDTVASLRAALRSLGGEA